VCIGMHIGRKPPGRARARVLVARLCTAGIAGRPTVQAILDAAAAVLAEHGVDGASTRETSARAGVKALTLSATDGASWTPWSATPSTASSRRSARCGRPATRSWTCAAGWHAHVAFARADPVDYQLAAGARHRPRAPPSCARGSPTCGRPTARSPSTPPNPGSRSEPDMQDGSYRRRLGAVVPEWKHRIRRPCGRVHVVLGWSCRRSVRPVASTRMRCRESACPSLGRREFLPTRRR